MDDFVTLTCTSCGGKLKITPDLENFACSYCGVEYMVKRDEGTIALKPLVDELMKMSVSLEKAANQIEINRLNLEISQLASRNEGLKKQYHQEIGQLEQSETDILKIDQPVLFYIVSFFVIMMILGLLSSCVAVTLSISEDSPFAFLIWVVTLGLTILILVMNPKRILKYRQLKKIERAKQEKTSEFERTRISNDRQIEEMKLELDKNESAAADLNGG